MKLSHPIAIKLVSWLASLLIRVWIGSLRIRFAIDDPDAVPQRMGDMALYIFWHEMLLLPAYTHAHAVTLMVSNSADGELIAQTIAHLGGRAIRGSTRHGGEAALRRMIRHGQHRHLGLTVDGPQGPVRVVSPGTIFLAGCNGMPIVPLGLAYSRCRRVGRRGRYIALPMPFCRARIVGGKPIVIPTGLDKDQRERLRREVQQAIDEVQARAERLASGEEPDTPLLTLGEVMSL